MLMLLICLASCLCWIVLFVGTWTVCPLALAFALIWLIEGKKKKKNIWEWERERKRERLIGTFNLFTYFYCILLPYKITDSLILKLPYHNYVINVKFNCTLPLWISVNLSMVVKNLRIDRPFSITENNIVMLCQVLWCVIVTWKATFCICKRCTGMGKSCQYVNPKAMT